MGEPIPIPPTQRAYTLRLRSPDRQDKAWRDALWATHNAVNKGAKSFGNWLLTLRGGINHQLAGDDAERRTLLALSWLSVESAPHADELYEQFVIDGEKENIIAALRQILAERGLKKAELESWIVDCSPALTAEIRDDARWINRSQAFDEARKRIGKSLTREEIWDILEPFFGSKEAYLAPLKAEDDEDKAKGEEKAKDLVQKAGGWLSSRFGAGKGADFKTMAEVYQAIAVWAEKTKNGPTSARTVEALTKHLRAFQPTSPTAEGILGLISGPGHKSGTHELIRQWNNTTDLDKLCEAALVSQDKCKAKVGGKGRRSWADSILKDVESQCGFTYLQTGGRARHKEFSVMLDHAARRVSIAHSWIKRAEAERRKFAADAQRVADVPDAIRSWLDTFCRARSASTGAIDGYRIRKRAIEGWKEIVTKWSRVACKTTQDRISAARELQSDPSINKFGDIQLFEALASDDAQIIWRNNGKSNAKPLMDYVIATDAQAKRQRFKVPAYRHPDPLSHPVFCDFGNSRWDIRFDIHEQHKAKDKKRKSTEEFHPRGLRMGLWNGMAITDEIPLRWGCHRLVNDLALSGNGKGDAVEVTRADRLGRAVAGIDADASVSIASLFDQKDWNGRLQAPRRELDVIARHLKNNGNKWDYKAEKMCRRLHWLVSFSAKLQPKGPWNDFVDKFSEDASSKPFISAKKGEYAVKHENNDQRKGMGKLVLSRLPGLRLISVDLGHRYAAACAVWQTLSRKELLNEIRGRKIVAGGTKDDHLFLHTEHKIDGKTRRTIYRRIGLEKLPNGSEHPAPWARLDRQFLIKLQGEEESAREASNEEIWECHKRESELDISFCLIDRMVHSGWGKENKQPERLDYLRKLGWVPATPPDAKFTEQKPKLAVDELMSDAVRTVRLALRWHSDLARIAFRLTCKEQNREPVSLEKIPQPEQIDHLVDVLLLWHELAASERWHNDWALEYWNHKILPLIQKSSFISPPSLKDADKNDKKKIERHEKTTREWQKIWENLDKPLTRKSTDGDEDRAVRKSRRESLESLLKPVAEALRRDSSLRKELSAQWTNYWAEMDEKWKPRLKWLRGWLLPRNLAKPLGDESEEDHKERIARCAAARHVGGLSLTRIATIRSFWQVAKAFRYRPRPKNTRAGIERIEKDAREGRKFGDRILQAMEHMREQRVKQLASRIVEAALGIGSENRKEHWQDETKRPRARIDDPRFAPCHAVVIENLTNYRPEEKRTRRENRQLMIWSAAQVKKYLSEGCQLHGLHLREVSAAYTSRQDSRTGMPGIRYADVSTKEFKTRHWRSRVDQAVEKVQEARKQNKHTDAESELLSAIKANQQNPPLLRLPLKSGDLFISTDNGRTLQADLNAAANIGLRALMDPDWPGRWWYVPAEIGDDGWRKPAEKSCAGAACLKDFKVAQNSYGSFSRNGTPLTISDDQGVKSAEDDLEAARKALDAAKVQLKRAGKQKQGLEDAEQVVETKNRDVKSAKESLSAAKKGATAQEILNLWSDCSSEKLSTRQNGQAFKTYDHYWNGVRQKIANLLREKNGLPG